MTIRTEQRPKPEIAGPDFGNYRVVVLAGGVGGAKMAHGFSQLLPAENLTIIVNTGDDFHHFGLQICPDLDTVVYTLSDLVDQEKGWGRKNESWRVLDEVRSLGGPDWFQLGDLDIATHLVRSYLLAEGRSLTEATQHICCHFGLNMQILPMSDQSAPTMIESEIGLLTFQEWFVAEGWQPTVRKVLFPEGIQATPEVIDAIQNADILVIAPSNPFVSIDPILNVGSVEAMVAELPGLVVAVTPIIDGRAVKGPAAKIMAEMGMEASSAGVARYYRRLIDLFIYDHKDKEPVAVQGLEGLRTNTLMPTAAERKQLAIEIMNRSVELIIDDNMGDHTR